MRIKIKKLCDDAAIPKYATPGSSGFDLVAIEDVTIEPGETKLIKTGLAFEIPEGYELQIRPRSGMSLKTPLRISNSPGTLDSDFHLEACIIMTNTQAIFPISIPGVTTLQCVSYAQYINKGDRIAQGVICPIIQADFIEVEELSTTQRSGGFGSTGV